ncbi:sugar phosphate isomerase/epimerase [Mesorhizobium sp. M4B.F.Ca.ET.190.01.1.1]|uniref:sugar phosphate isomerase/epimerase family protein n=1 Tax=unclassified Mesorhizobium TaxID=325217 RepID=UPI000493F522|nr:MULTISPECIES: xylose isomerase [Mesorhizobium]RUW85046.1 sugar phosphate isomerase/epimerase [Mesorhizobium sp. M1E.F.Ca.ET.063.01.1.1]RWF38373.1 MAG: sugar phosphate isomerase/epimerase [Mesorhizobium sp.]RWO96715.1 MAG: sugar phosphate isomerase/epimerase [Mesorhizobium sp.]TGQ99399.1 sugar phosphate isomerase/epimerase [Mesorhizobium sp. M4B.F.Ca.ET.200.01.1.1]TGS11689.1 sugar phosphate isomerase/epimerase [Mesorhizobium sp. M4B.F.Ca.ET.190.01.1.1]
MQNLLIFQSLWSMELRSARYPERTLEDNIDKIFKAGFQGVSADWRDRSFVKKLSALLKDNGMQAEGQCFPRTVDDLKPVLENAVEFGVHHIDLQPDVRPRRVQECIPLLEGWRRLAHEAGVEVYIETHRDRMTTDLHFTLDLLDCFPDLRLLGDLSHFVVGREFAWPIPDEHHVEIHRILDNSWAFHGRVATREQVQIEISYPQHKMWVDQFLSWWEYGFRSWQQRASKDDSLSFTCELGPKPYAITGPDGEDTVDRWAESLLLKDHIARVWKNSIINQ